MARGDSGRLTLRAIEIFVAVVEEGSFAAGADRLGASTSSVSQQVTNLEAALGARLIDRSARPLALTPAGFLFQRRALAILDEATRAKSELVELELTTLAQLRLSMLEDFDAEVTPELVVRLSESLPGCNIIAHGGPSHQNLAEARETTGPSLRRQGDLPLRTAGRGRTEEERVGPAQDERRRDRGRRLPPGAAHRQHCGRGSQ